MTRRWLGWLVCLAVLSAPSGLAADDRDDAAIRLAKRVEDLHGQATTFKAKFRQTFVHRATKKKTVSHGRLAAADGGRLSFRYASPKGDRVVSNGKLIKIYERAEKTMYIMRLTRAKHAFGVAFLLGTMGLTKNFKLRLVDPQRKKVKNGSVLEAIPKRANPLVARLILYVDPLSAQVLRVMVVDAQGNTNRFDFDARVFDTDVPDKEFSFKPPRGTKVVIP